MLERFLPWPLFPSCSPQPSKRIPHLSPHRILRVPPAVTHPPFSLLLPQKESAPPVLCPWTPHCQGTPKPLLGLSCSHLLVQDYKLSTFLSLYLENLVCWINAIAGEEAGGRSLTPTLCAISGLLCTKKAYVSIGWGT